MYTLTHSTSFNKRGLLRLVGNALIAGGFLGLLLTFYPLITEEWRYQFNTPQETYAASNPSKEFVVRIPTVKIVGNVVENVDPYNEQVYREALTQGVAHASTSSLPDENGLVYLFAHSSDSPWNLSRYNTAFYRLGRVKPYDPITITYKGKDYKYVVTELKTVWPHETKYLTEQQEGMLILQTCSPIGTDWQRLLVFAKRIE